jgi:hypothetical protein
MSDSRRVQSSLMSVIQPELEGANVRNVETLTWALTGLLLQKTVSLPLWASCLPDESEAAAREQRLRRWLNNPAVKVHLWYRPFITQALRSWTEHLMYIALDTSMLAKELVLARTALIYRGRAVPLAWQVFQHGSSSLAFEQYSTILKATKTLIPINATVVLLGDAGFRDIRLMRLCRHFRWNFRLRIAENEYIWLNQHTRRRVDSWPLEPYQPRYFQQVRLTDQRYGPLNLALGWDGDPAHDPWRIVTDQPATRRTLAEYAQRAGIEAGFLDDKSAGFQLHESQLVQPARMNRLLLVLALGSLYLVSLGTRLVATGQRRLVDPHWQRRLSYLHLGWRWLDYLLARDAPLPLWFLLDSAPDPEPFPLSNPFATP